MELIFEIKHDILMLLHSLIFAQTGILLVKTYALLVMPVWGELWSNRSRATFFGASASVDALFCLGGLENEKESF